MSILLNRRSALSFCLLILLFSSANVSATILTSSYINIQISDTVGFGSAGNVQNFGTNMNAALQSLSIGQYFRFGISARVTENPNTASGGAWELAGGTLQPATLGAAALAMRVNSTDPAGSILAAVQGPPFVNEGRNTSKLTFVGGDTSWGFVTEPGDVLGTAAPGTLNALGSGQVGQLFPLYSANSAPTPTALTILTGPDEPWFNGLMFKLVGPGGFTLTPTFAYDGVAVWYNNFPGDPSNLSNGPTYRIRLFSDAAESDTVINPEPIVYVPEPAGIAILTIAGIAAISRRSRKRRISHRPPEYGHSVERRGGLVFLFVVLGFCLPLQAATITISYVNAQVSDNVNFNAAGNVQTLNTISDGFWNTLPIGKFFRFGITVGVTGNANPAFNSAWSQATGIPQPQFLGLSQMALKVRSTDPAGSNVAAVQGNPALANFGTRNVSKAIFTGGGNHAASNSLWTNTLDPGDVLDSGSPGTNNQLGKGEVGLHFQISSSNSAGTPSAIRRLATPGEVWFNSLTYQITSPGPVQLALEVDTEAILFWTNNFAGDPNDLEIGPLYRFRRFAANDVIRLDTIPEPNSMILLVVGVLCVASRRGRPRPLILWALS